jgi:hypothetical protein
MGTARQTVAPDDLARLFGALNVAAVRHSRGLPADVDGARSAFLTAVAAAGPLDLDALVERIIDGLAVPREFRAAAGRQVIIDLARLFPAAEMRLALHQPEGSA